MNYRRAESRGLIAATLVATLFAININVNAGPTDQFRQNPVAYFTEGGTQTWVGNGLYFGKNYADTLQFTSPGKDKPLAVRRVLVETDSLRVISRGNGTVTALSGGKTFDVAWTEKRYPAISGKMNWIDGQWVIQFDGSWSDWSLRIHQDSTLSLVAAAARMIPGLHPVEVASMTYRRVR